MMMMIIMMMIHMLVMMMIMMPIMMTMMMIQYAGSSNTDSCGVRAHALTEWRLEPPP